MASVGCVRDDGTAPVVVVQDRFGDLTTQNLDALAAYISNPAAGALPDRPVQNFANGPTRYYTPYGTLNAANGLPAIGPPWSVLTAYDMNEGTIKWQVPLGEVTALAADGGQRDASTGGGSTSTGGSESSGTAGSGSSSGSGSTGGATGGSSMASGASGASETRSGGGGGGSGCGCAVVGGSSRGVGFGSWLGLFGLAMTRLRRRRSRRS